MTHIRLNPPLTKNGYAYPGEANRIFIVPIDDERPAAAYVAMYSPGSDTYGRYAYLTREQTEALISELQKTLR